MVISYIPHKLRISSSHIIAIIHSAYNYGYMSTGKLEPYVMSARPGTEFVARHGQPRLQGSRRRRCQAMTAVGCGILSNKIAAYKTKNDVIGG